MGTAWCICLAIMTLAQSGGQDEDVPRRIIRQYPLQMTKLYVRPGKRNGKRLFLVDTTRPRREFRLVPLKGTVYTFCFVCIVHNTNIKQSTVSFLCHCWSTWLGDALFVDGDTMPLFWFKIMHVRNARWLRGEEKRLQI